MFRRLYKRMDGKVAENDKFAVFVYPYPDESGQKKWHAHFVRKSDQTDAKISVWTFELMRPTKFDRRTVKDLVMWTYENRHYLRKRWFQLVTKPFWKDIDKWGKKDG